MRFSKIDKSSHESDVVKFAIDFLLQSGYFVWRNNTGAMPWRDRYGQEKFMRFGKVGSSDILGISPAGRFVAIECKDKSKATEKQLEFLEEIKRRGGIGLIIHSPEELMEGLKNANR